MIVVRDARAADAAAWRAIVLEAATDDRTIATWPDEVWSEREIVERIADAKAERSMLVALMALLRVAEDRARAWGVTKMSLGVFADNEGAARLYRRLGYVEEGIRRDHYLVGGRMRDEVLMAKRLGEPA